MPSDESGENATSSTTGMAATNNTGDVDDGGGDAREGAKGIREISVPLLSTAVNLSLLYEVYFKKGVKYGKGKTV